MLTDRFWNKVDQTASCWNWTARLHSGGYGRIKIAGKMHYAHRLSYEAHTGPIPDDLVIDHLCHNRTCVNPKHLEAVTPKRNAERRAGPQVNNRVGIRGAAWHELTGKWFGQVQHNYQVHRLGPFENAEEAGAAAYELRKELFKDHE